MYYTQADPEDEPFLFQLYKESRMDEVQLWGWEESAQDAFLHMQWMAQKHSYAAQYPHAEQLIVYVEDVQVGRIIVSRYDHKIVLVDITILKQYQNQKIGTTLLTELQTEAASTSKSLHLSVLHSNPAFKLYERLGFKRTDNNGLYYSMEWNSHN
ncbi:GNAT family N-acetyltransferase [Paenibacillus assamensis]|uniref:GNAT family N-acetyltransferase n=1 Tax=Paenibacillus assamensis TaxID=311244 RepID=UPI0003FB67EE|nr:GNAT family N-acetyltransferase [Paenibacillus assamensis]